MSSGRWFRYGDRVRPGATVFRSGFRVAKARKELLASRYEEVGGETCGLGEGERWALADDGGNQRRTAARP